MLMVEKNDTANSETTHDLHEHTRVLLVQSEDKSNVLSLPDVAAAWGHTDTRVRGRGDQTLQET